MHCTTAVDAGTSAVAVRTSTPSRPTSAAEPVDERPVGAGHRRQPAELGRPLDEHDAVARASAATRAVSSPAGPPPTTATSRGARAGTYQSGSSVSRPEVGSPMHVTIGFRASRTWHVWLQRVHGRIRSGCPARSLATRSGSAIWARVISTAAHDAGSS